MLNKFYSEKSKAKRALNGIGLAALQAAEQLLFQGPDGRWGFDLDAAEAVQNGHDNADDAAQDEPTVAPAAPRMIAARPSVLQQPPRVFTSTLLHDAHINSLPVLPAADNVGSCPCCGADHTEQTWASKGVSVLCHKCNKTWSLKSHQEVRNGYTRPNAPKGYTIEKDRPVQNGVKRPSTGTTCGQVWAAFDAQPDIQAKQLRELAERNNWNFNNVSCEYYNWRKFNGIKGRTAK